jgi:hypothetical protein
MNDAIEIALARNKGTSGAVLLLRETLQNANMATA